MCYDRHRATAVKYWTWYRAKDFIGISKRVNFVFWATAYISYVRVAQLSSKELDVRRLFSRQNCQSDHDKSTPMQRLWFKAVEKRAFDRFDNLWGRSRSSSIYWRRFRLSAWLALPRLGISEWKSRKGWIRTACHEEKGSASGQGKQTQSHQRWW